MTELSFARARVFDLRYRGLHLAAAHSDYAFLAPEFEATPAKPPQQHQRHHHVDPYANHVGATSTKPTHTYLRAMATEMRVTHHATGHTGCINSVEFNDSATLLLTGSDDTRVGIYSTNTLLNTSTTTTTNRNSKRLQCIGIFPTAHTRNIFNAIFVPQTGDRHLASCGLDGATVLTELDEHATTMVSSRIIADSDHMCSCIETSALDPNVLFVTRGMGGVAVIDVRLRREVGSFSVSSAMATPRPCNGIAAHPHLPHLLAVGSDSPVIYLCDTRKLPPHYRNTSSQPQQQQQQAPLAGAAFAAITNLQAAGTADGVGGLNFSDRGDKIVVSYKGGEVVSFDWQSALPSLNRRKISDETSHAMRLDAEQNLFRHATVTEVQAKTYCGRQNVVTMFKEAAFFCDDQLIVSGGDCGNVFIWDARTTRLLHKVRGDADIVNGVLTHPALPFVVACGIESTAKVIGVGQQPKVEKKSSVSRAKSGSSSTAVLRQSGAASSSSQPTAATTTTSVSGPQDEEDEEWVDEDSTDNNSTNDDDDDDDEDHDDDSGFGGQRHHRSPFRMQADFLRQLLLGGNPNRRQEEQSEEPNNADDDDDLDEMGAEFELWNNSGGGDGDDEEIGAAASARRRRAAAGDDEFHSEEANEERRAVIESTIVVLRQQQPSRGTPAELIEFFTSRARALRMLRESGTRVDNEDADAMMEELMMRGVPSRNVNEEDDEAAASSPSSNRGDSQQERGDSNSDNDSAAHPPRIVVDGPFAEEHRSTAQHSLVTKDDESDDGQEEGEANGDAEMKCSSNSSDASDQEKNDFEDDEEEEGDDDDLLTQLLETVQTSIDLARSIMVRLERGGLLSDDVVNPRVARPPTATTTAAATTGAASSPSSPASNYHATHPLVTLAAAIVDVTFVALREAAKT